MVKKPGQLRAQDLPALTDRPQLFRAEALANRQQQLIGDMLLVRSSQRMWPAIAAVAIAVLILALLIFGSYTRKEEVTGRISMDDGPAEIFAPTIGTVTRQFVHEGDLVKTGEPLVELSTEKTTAAGKSHEAIGFALTARKTSLEDELLKEKDVFDIEIRSLQARMANLKSEIDHVDSQLTVTVARYELSNAEKKRFSQLRSEDVVSQSEYDQRQQETLFQAAQLEDLRKQRSSSAGSLAQIKADLANAPLKEENELGNIRRQILEVEAEIADNESNREITISAAIDGTVTAVLSRKGQVVNPAKPLMSLLPKGGRFAAQLFVPSKAIGFIKNGDQVLMRYEAFPYQKFGMYRGTVAQISRTAIPAVQLQLAGSNTNDMLYRLIVNLDSQTVNAYGVEIPLQDGMRLEGDILIDQRKIYEWILEPLYSLSKRY